MSQLFKKDYDVITSTSEEAIEKIEKLEKGLSPFPQSAILTSHMIHGGMYCRTCFIPANSMFTSVMIKKATFLIICGHIISYINDEAKEIEGYTILAGSEKRQAAFLTLGDTYMSMVFPTNVKTVEEAEKEFTDNTDALNSNKFKDVNMYAITGE